MHILHKMNAHWRHDSLLHWRTWIEDKLNAFSKNNCVSEFTSQLFLYFLSCLHKNKKCSPPLSLRPFQVNEKEHFCVKYLNVLKNENKLFFLLLNIITTKISSERTSAIIMKKKIDPTLSVYGKLNPSQPQPHENQLTQSTCNHIKTNCLPWWNLKTRTQGIYNL